MKTRKLRFTRNTYYDCFAKRTVLGEEFISGKRYKRAEICVDRLAEFVEFPKDTKTIMVIGHTRPGKNRMEIAMHSTSDLDIDGEFTLMYQDTGLLAERWIKTGHKYISIQY